MTKWLQSGRRRDICAIIADEGAATGQHVKTRLERHDEERVEPKSFRGALSALEDAGIVKRQEAGIAEEYTLTDAGEQRLREHYAWLSDCLD